MERESFEALCISHQESLEQIRLDAHRLHESVNQFYDGDKPYGYHLDMVAKEVYAYGHLVLVGGADLLPLFMGAWFHDSIEDARVSYNDVKKIALKFGLTQKVEGRSHSCLICRSQRPYRAFMGYSAG